MKIKIKDIELDLHYSMRMYIIYENIMGKSLNFENASSYTSLIVLLYSSIIATIQKNKLDITITYDEFMDWLDTQNAQKVMTDFSEWFTSQLTANIDLKDVNTKEVKDKNTSEKIKSKN